MMINSLSNNFIVQNKYITSKQVPSFCAKKSSQKESCPIDYKSKEELAKDRKLGMAIVRAKENITAIEKTLATENLSIEQRITLEKSLALHKDCYYTNREKLFTKHIAYAKYIADTSYSVLSIEEKESAALHGLYEATKKWNPLSHPDIPFSTYSAAWIKNSLWIDTENRIYQFKIPHTSITKKRKIDKCKRELTERLHREPTNTELANATGCTIGTIISLHCSAIPLDSFRDIQSENPTGADTIILDVSNEKHNNNIASKQKKVDLENMKMFIAQLSPIEQIVITRRYKLNEEQNANDHLRCFQEISDELKISKERIRQIEAGAISKLHTMMKDYN